MLVPSPIVKLTAKDALKTKIIPSIIVACVLIFTFYIVSFISTIVSVFAGDIGFLVTNTVFSLFIISPLCLGVLNYFNRILWGQNDSVILIFKYFSSTNQYKRALRFIINITLKFLHTAAFVFLPCAVILLLSSEAFFALLNVPLPVWTSILSGVNAFVLLLSLFALMFIMLKYYLSAFIFISNDSVEPAEAINMSTIISRRSGGDFFGLVLSFVPWFLLSVLVIPLIFTLPYFITSYAVHCHHAIEAYNTDVEHFGAGFAPSFSTDEI